MQIPSLLSFRASSDRQTPGAIPPLAEMQAQVWIHNLLKQLRPNVVPRRSSDALDSYELDYKLHPRSFPTTRAATADEPGADVRTINMAETKRGVDQESYAYQLALDIGGAPTIGHVIKNYAWRSWWVWAMGPNFNPKLRMVGPFKMSDAQLREIFEEELWKITRRSGWFVCTCNTLISVP